MRTWHAREAFDYMDCKGKSLFEEVLNWKDLKMAREAGFDPKNFYHQIQNFCATPLGDTQAFLSEANRQYLDLSFYRYTVFHNIVNGDVNEIFVSSGREMPKPGSIYRDQPGCLFGNLYVIMLIVLAYREQGETELANHAAWALRMQFWISAGGPESAVDLIQSTSWPFDSWDIVAMTMTLGPQLPPNSYAEYVAGHPLPAPSLPPNLELMPMPAAGPQPRGGASRLCSRALQIVSLGMMRQNMMHHLAVLRLALTGICAGTPPAIEVIMDFGQPGPLSEYEMGQPLEHSFQDPGKQLCTRNHKSKHPLENATEIHWTIPMKILRKSDNPLEHTTDK